MKYVGRDHVETRYQSGSSIYQRFMWTLSESASLSFRWRWFSAIRWFIEASATRFVRWRSDTQLQQTDRRLKSFVPLSDFMRGRTNDWWGWVNKVPLVDLRECFRLYVDGSTRATEMEKTKKCDFTFLHNETPEAAGTAWKHRGHH